MSSTKLVKILIWLYFFLLIFEGALRKWFLPGLAQPLLVIRDPVALAAVVIGLRLTAFYRNPWPKVFWAIGGFAAVATLLVGHGHPFVTFFGLRIFAVHLPFFFLVATVFQREDVEQMGRALLLLSIPMTFLIAAQYQLPETHYLNVGVGGEGTAGFSGALGHLRPPGTFSFTTGTTMFYAAVCAVLGGFLLSAKFRPWMVLPLGCLIVAVPMSISRALFLHAAISGMFVVGAILLSGRGAKNFARFAVVMGIAVLAALPLGITQDAMETFSARWETAEAIEGKVDEAIVSRVVESGMVESIKLAFDQPLFGQGLGLGTNVGAVTLSGERGFLIAEAEWGRIAGEMGPLLGILVIVLRIVLGFSLFRKSFRLMRGGDPFPFLLASVAIIWILKGDWAQPTSLGFCILIGGLAFASLNRQEKEKEEPPEETWKPPKPVRKMQPENKPDPGPEEKRRGRPSRKQEAVSAT